MTKDRWLILTLLCFLWRLHIFNFCTFGVGWWSLIKKELILLCIGWVKKQTFILQVAHPKTPAICFEVKYYYTNRWSNQTTPTSISHSADLPTFFLLIPLIFHFLQIIYFSFSVCEVSLDALNMHKLEYVVQKLTEQHPRERARAAHLAPQVLQKQNLNDWIF